MADDEDLVSSTKADRRRAMGGAKAHGDRLNEAYEAGRRGEAPPADATEEELQAHGWGSEDRPRQDRGSSRPTPARPGGRAGARPAAPARPTRGWDHPAVAGATTVGSQGAAALAGVIAYALAINYLRYGWPGVSGWLSAKFLNQVTLKTQGPGQGTNTVPATGLPATRVSAQ